MFSVYRRRAVALHAYGSLRTVSSSTVEEDARIPYTLGTHQLVPKKYTVGRKIAVRSYLDRNRSELSDRTYFPQKQYFEPYVPKAFAHDYELAAHLFYSVETKLIWKAFDTPELVPMVLFDETVKTSAGRRGVEAENANGGDDATRFHTNLFSVNMIDNALHWTRETRYWRCLGITKPFFDKNTLRVHCWEDDGMQVGTLKMSAAMRHALMDLERAWRRKELGLEPNYLWDNWGPIGFIDGRKTDYLPRFEHNPYMDPDGVEVSEVDILPFNTHEQIRERYGEFIYPETTPFESVFLSPSHSTLTLEDIPNEDVVELYKQLQQVDKKTNQLALSSESSPSVSPADMRALFYLCAEPTLLDEVLKGVSESAESSDASAPGKYRTWEDVRAAVAPLQEENDLRVDFARLLDNTRHSAERVRSFYEEKCGFVDFSYTNDKTITGATLALLSDMRTVLEQHGDAWATNLANALTDVEKFNAMGPTAFRVFRLIENAIVDHRRRQWATRFAGESNEESTLDYLLENFGRRPERQKSVGSTGVEFDREQEPIGRQVQRRVLDSDKSNKLADFRRSKGRIWNKKKNVFEALHQKQLQNFSYGVR